MAAERKIIEDLGLPTTTTDKLYGIPIIKAACDGIVVSYNNVKEYNFLTSTIASLTEFCWKFTLAMMTPLLFPYTFLIPYLDKWTMKRIDDLLDKYPQLQSSPKELEYEMRVYIDHLAKIYPLTVQLIVGINNSCVLLKGTIPTVKFAIYYFATLPFRIPVFIVERVVYIWFIPSPPIKELEEPNIIRRIQNLYKRIYAHYSAKKEHEKPKEPAQPPVPKTAAPAAAPL